MSRRRGVGWAVVALGLALVVVGLVGIVTNDGSDRQAAASPATAPSTATTAPTASSAAPTTSTAASTTSTLAPASTLASTSTTAPPDETPAEFFAAFGRAWAGRDAAFLFGRLHPLVLSRYGEEGCRAYLSRLDVPRYAVEVLRVDALALWDWRTDGLTDRVDAITVGIRFTEDGTTFHEQDVHIALLSGAMRWFTDCGQPLSS